MSELDGASSTRSGSIPSHVCTAIWWIALACNPASQSKPAHAPAEDWRRLCSSAPLPLQGPGGDRPSRGCVVEFAQPIDDPISIDRYGSRTLRRRYLLYAPELRGPAPVVMMFPGYTANAEAAALYYTHGRLEELADRDGFIVVYGNGLPYVPPGESGIGAAPEGGYFVGCFAEHSGEGVDVQYARQVIDGLAKVLPVDRSRIYATGLSAGGGMALQLAIEAPDLVAAVAPVAFLPFWPEGRHAHHCRAQPGHDRVSIAMLAATHDPFIAYEPGPSREYPHASYPGMEQTRDAWLRALHIEGTPTVKPLPDSVQGDSFKPHTGLSSSHLEVYTYPPGPDGQELVYYKAVGMGHWWPHPQQIWKGLWSRHGHTNQDVDYTDHAWEFLRRHQKQATGASSPR